MPFLITQLEGDLLSSSESEGEDDQHSDEWPAQNVPPKVEIDRLLKKLQKKQPPGPNRKKNKKGKENSPKQPPKKHSTSSKKKQWGKSMDGTETPYTMIRHRMKRTMMPRHFQ